MAEQAREWVVLTTHGADTELSSVAFAVANGAITAGMTVFAFLCLSDPGLERGGRLIPLSVISRCLPEMSDR
jgi:hypothetical protein